MPTAGAERPEGQDASGIGFYFNADDTWHSGSEAPPRVWDPAWSAPPHAEWPGEPRVRRRRSGLAVALGLALMAAAAVALAWNLTPARRLSPPVRQTEPPSAVLVPPLPVEPPAPPAPTVANATPAPAPARTEGPARRPAVARLTHHRQHLRTAHRRHASVHAGVRPHARTLKRPAAHGLRSSHRAHPAAHGPRHGHAPTRIRRASKAAT
jgi:hypothetical protein